MIPVTQKKLTSPEMKRNISHAPISERVRWLLVKTILIIRKTVNFISWKSWRPEILSISFIFLNSERNGKDSSDNKRLQQILQSDFPNFEHQS